MVFMECLLYFCGFLCFFPITFVMLMTMYNAVTTMDSTTTGIKALGEAMGGRIRPGSLVIIEGESGSGKSILTEHLAYGALLFGSQVAYYTTEKSSDEMIYQMESFSMPVRHETITDRLRVYSVRAINNIEDTLGALKSVMGHIASVPQRFNTVVLDCLTPFLNTVKPSDKLDLFLNFKEICGGKRSIILVVHSHLLEKSNRSRVFSMSDYYLKISTSNRIISSGMIDERSLKALEICKLNRVEMQNAETIEFEIKPRVGIQILPFCKVKI